MVLGMSFAAPPRRMVLPRRRRARARSRFVVGTRSSSSHPLFFMTPPPLLPMCMCSTTTAAAASSLVVVGTTLLLSATVGFVAERRLVRHSGILATLTTAMALASSLRQRLPRQHVLYDLCWSTVLPASLALLLLSLGNDNNEKSKDDDDGDDVNAHVAAVPAAIARLAVPFALATLGSVLGCLVSFLVCYHFPTLWLPPRAARQAAACLTASFIGGSVNFFATAAAIGNSSSSSTTTSSNTLVSAMAAVDIIVMALYFAVLSAALQSKKLQRWFDNGNDSDANARRNDVQRDVSVVLAAKEEEKDDSSLVSSTTTNNDNALPAAIMVSLLAWGLVELAKRLEAFVSGIVPGTACAFLAAAVPALTRLPMVVPAAAANKNNLAPLWTSMRRVAEPLSSFAFLLLFAAIGVSADLGAALQSGPACLLFSATALGIHGIVTLGGSFLYNQVRRRTFLRKWKRGGSLRLSDVLTASNAAIGGPATAAAFTIQVQGLKSEEKRGLTVAATVWGVVGYAMGTTVGVALYRFLRSRFSV